MDSLPPSSHAGRYWVVLAVTSLTVAGIIFSANNRFYREYERDFAITPSPSLEKSPGVLVTIDFGNGKKRAFKGHASDGMTAYRALATSSEVGHFPLVTDPNGRVTAIAGVKEGLGHTWKLYVNGLAIAGVPGNIDVKAGDAMEFRFE